jgi:LysM repeat protein
MTSFFKLVAATTLAGLIAVSMAAPCFAADEEIWAIEMRQGDTISAIARRYLVNPNDWMKLQQFNNVRLDKAMPVGTRVNVPASWMRIADLDAQIVAVRGKVRIDRAGKEVPATVGTAIRVGDRIVAGEASSVTLKFTDGSLSSLHANTDARIDLMRGVTSLRSDCGWMRVASNTRSRHARIPRRPSRSRPASPPLVFAARNSAPRWTMSVGERFSKDGSRPWEQGAPNRSPSLRALQP